MTDEMVATNENVTLYFVRRDGTHGWGSSGSGDDIQPPYPNEQFMGRYHPDSDPQWTRGWPEPHVYLRVTEDYFNRWTAAREAWLGFGDRPPPLLATEADVLEPSIY